MSNINFSTGKTAWYPDPAGTGAGCIAWPAPWKAITTNETTIQNENEVSSGQRIQANISRKITNTQLHLQLVPGALHVGPALPTQRQAKRGCILVGPVNRHPSQQLLSTP